MSEFDLAADLNLTAGALRGLTDDEDRFRAWYDAFLAGDADSYRRILAKASVLEHEDLLCGWLCSKECVRLCWRLCGPPRLDRIPEPRELAEVIVKLTSADAGAVIGSRRRAPGLQLGHIGDASWCRVPLRRAAHEPAVRRLEHRAELLMGSATR